MLIYEGPHLDIHFEEEQRLLVQNWSNPPSTFKQFKKEMTVFVKCFKEQRAKKALWMHRNYNLQLNATELEWVEKNVNIPCAQSGAEMCAFVVGENALLHLMIVRLMDRMQDKMQIDHFATIEEARAWLTREKNVFHPMEFSEIVFEGVEGDQSILKLKTPTSSLLNTLRAFKSLLDDNDFVTSNAAKFHSLSSREKQLLVLFAKGMKPKSIADHLHLSIHTIRTHRKSIYQKLAIKSMAEGIRYVEAFKLAF